MHSYTFLPEPRSVEWLDLHYSLENGALIQLDATEPQSLVAAGKRIRSAVAKTLGYAWVLAAGPAAAGVTPGALLRLDPEAIPHQQGYILDITNEGVRVTAHDPAGAFYAACTLEQLVAQAGAALPGLHIVDWPDFPARGVMLDISRDRVYNQKTLLELVDRLASLKINQLQLYTEHTFAYRGHPAVWQKASPLTGEEIMDLDAACRERFIDLVPNQNSFGHMERWLRLPEYAHLAETHDSFPVPWGTQAGPFSLAPEHPETLPFLRSLYDELLPHFTSSMFNVGCDETFDLGQGQSKAICAKRGTPRVYLDFLKKLHAEVSSRGKTMQFWGDIIHDDPKLVSEIPHDAIALEWGYEAGHPFDARCSEFARAGIPFYVCPGTSSWNSLGGRTDNCLENLKNAAAAGLKHGAIGYLNTDWGDNGHWQPLSVAFLGFGMGAAYSWCLAANERMDPAKPIGMYLFDDPSGAVGKLMVDLGNVYQQAGLALPNSSALFYMLQFPLEVVSDYSHLGENPLLTTLSTLDVLSGRIGKDGMTGDDAGLNRREAAQVVRMMRHACQRALFAFESEHSPSRAELAATARLIVTEQKALWLERSRSGGLKDSLRNLERNLAEFLAEENV